MSEKDLEEKGKKSLFYVYVFMIELVKIHTLSHHDLCKYYNTVYWW